VYAKKASDDMEKIDGMICLEYGGLFESFSRLSKLSVPIAVLWLPKRRQFHRDGSSAILVPQNSHTRFSWFFEIIFSC
jgi:hypothetical protein